MNPIATFTGTLTALDCKHNLPHVFNVPSGLRGLRIAFEFSPHKPGEHYNMITLSVFGPDGFRGAGHRHGSRHEVLLGAGACTPGYYSGPITPGSWQVVLDTHMVTPDARVTYTLGVFMDETGRAPAPSPITQPPARKRGPGWYRGDLHAHTVHSDASWDVPDLLAWARAQKLDFVTLTDHNTTSPLPQFLAGADDGLLCMGGMELTTFYGHALALGSGAWVDWRTEPGSARTMAHAANEVMKGGARFVIAHPRAEGDPYCTGCRWVHTDVWPAPARLVEIWNHDWSGDSHNDQGLALAYEWLNEGHRLAFTAGTDIHGPQRDEHYGFNVVNAPALTTEAVLAALEAGRSYISSGPGLRIEAWRGTHVAHMGDGLPGAGECALRVHIANAPADAVLRTIADGRVTHEAPASAAHREYAISSARWCTAELRDADGCMLAVTNPIFLSIA